MSITQSVADAFSVFGQKVIPNESDIARQIAKNGMQSITKNPGAYASEIYKKGNEAIDNDVAKALSKATYKDGNLAVDGVDGDTLKSVQEGFNSQRKELDSIANNEGALNENQLKFIKGQHGTIGGAYQKGKAYFTEDGKKAARIGTVAGTMVGARLLSGGGLTHNNTGERDIVGIPFI